MSAVPYTDFLASKAPRAVERGTSAARVTLPTTFDAPERSAARQRSSVACRHQSTLARDPSGSRRGVPNSSQTRASCLDGCLIERRLYDPRLLPTLDNVQGLIPQRVDALAHVPQQSLPGVPAAIPARSRRHPGTCRPSTRDSAAPDNCIGGAVQYQPRAFGSARTEPSNRSARQWLSTEALAQSGRAIHRLAKREFADGPYAYACTLSSVHYSIQSKFVGVELKHEYWRQSVENLKGASAQSDMFAA